MSDTIRNAIGAIAFVAAALFFINYVGNMSSNYTASKQKQTPPRAEVADKKAAPEPVAKEAAKKVTVAKPAPKPAPNPAQVANKAVARVIDADRGFKTFKRKCLGCHTVNKGAPNRTGPNLWGIVDMPKAAAEGYRYSRNLRTYGGTWTEADLSRFIAGPSVMVRDTKMTFRGLKVEADRLDIIAFLKTLKD